ncbi:amino acid adenylation domain-containing protein [Desulfobacterales bacterium]|nr:amino acid adenylation domain-containing protein [Desulfobacterales bacterium]
MGKEKSHLTYPLSPLQRGMLFHSLTSENSGVDIEQITFTLNEPLEVSIFAEAWNIILQCHEVLRTRFKWEDLDEPVQFVEPQMHFIPRYFDLKGASLEEKNQKVEGLIRDDRFEGFDMAVAPLMRVSIIQLDQLEFQVIWTFHHILLDGRSFLIVLKDLFNTYDSIMEGRQPNVIVPPPYRKYINFLKQIDNKKAEAFWKGHLNGFTAPTPIGLGRPKERSGVVAGATSAEEFVISEAVTLKLRRFAEANNVTLNNLFQGAWALLLHHYSGENDIVFGSTRACRHSGVPGSEKMVGLLINTVPVRIKFEEDISLSSFLEQVRKINTDLREYENTPLPSIMRWSSVPSGHPLFESLVVFENYLLNSALQVQGGKWAFRKFNYRGQTNFPITLIGYADKTLTARIEYDINRLDQKAARRMIGHFKTLLVSMMNNTDLPAAALKYITTAELDELRDKNTHPCLEEVNQCIQNRFESFADRYPDKIAVVFDQDRLTYGELNNRANLVANRLITMGLKPGTLIGLCFERSLEMIIGILGVLKAGGAYVPLDPAYPIERIKYIIKDAQVPVILTQRSLNLQFQFKSIETVMIDSVDHNLKNDSDNFVGNPLTEVTPGSLAYVIYTSGSTGNPKGVLITHANVMRLFSATDHWFEFNRDDVWTLFHSYAFDFSVWEIWGALLFGGRLIVVPYWTSRSPEEFIRLLAKEEVTVLNQTPSAFRQLAQAEKATNIQENLALRYIIFGGEALELKSLEPWIERHGDSKPQLINMYGITETTVHVTYRPITRKDVLGAQGSVIGQPIPDLQLYLLNSHMQPVPIGVIGEMYVGGSGLGLGYLNRPELTRDRFIPNPFDKNSSYRLYKTGDLARYLPNYDIEYIGRADFQVQIKGFRIELGEIESAISEHPAISESVVVATDNFDDRKQIVAYFVSKNGNKNFVRDLRKFLNKKIPEYMIPAAFVLMEAFPLTENGKIDRKALPSPDKDEMVSDESYVAPRNESERSLCKIFCNILGLKRVGIHDNFFTLGGDSILSIRIISEARRAGFSISPKVLFQAPTVMELANLGSQHTAHGPAKKDQGIQVGSMPLTPIQHWFFEQDILDKNYWNQAFMFVVPKNFKISLFEKAVEGIILHHDALRLSFYKNETGWNQEYSKLEKADYVLHIDLSGTTGSNRKQKILDCANKIQSSLDITRGSLIRVGYLDFGSESSGRLLIAIHHLAVDAVSWQIILSDLESVYLKHERGEKVSLPPKTTSYKFWSQRLSKYAQSEKLQQEVTFWQTEISEVTGRIPLDFQTASENNIEGSTLIKTVAFNENDTEILLRKIPPLLNVRIQDVLLFALSKSLLNWIGRKSLLIDLEGHGREDIFDDMDLSRTVGWFTTIYPVRVGVSDESVEHNLQYIKQQCQNVPNKGIGFGILQYLSRNQDWDFTTKRPNADVVFNFLGQLDRLVADSELFEFADEPVGPWHHSSAQRRYLIEVISYIKNGFLEVQWIFNKNFHREDTIERLIRDFSETIAQTIQSCFADKNRISFSAEFADEGTEQNQMKELESVYPDVEHVCQLSPMQELYYSLGSTAHDIGFDQSHFTISGSLDIESYQRAWQHTVNRHSALRSLYIAGGIQRPVQVVLKQVAIPMAEKDLRALPEQQMDAELERILRLDKAYGFELSKAPLTRLTLLRIKKDLYRVIWSHHHLQIDGWSWPIILYEVNQCYRAFKMGSEPSLPGTEPYGSYINWLQEKGNQGDSFWQEMFSDYDDKFILPVLHTATLTKGKPEKYNLQSIIFSEAETERIASCAKELKITQNTILQGAWALLLSAISGKNDIVFGASFSGRPPELSGVESMVGLFVNNLPIRLIVNPQESVTIWLHNLHKRVFDVGQHQHTDLTRIHQLSRIEVARRLFDSLIVFQNYTVDEDTWTIDNKTKIIDFVAPVQTNYLLTLIVVPGPQMSLEIGFQCQFYDSASVKELLYTLKSIVLSLTNGKVFNLQYYIDNAGTLKESFTAEDRHQGAMWRSEYTAPSTEVEKSLASIWEDIFRITKIGANDNFFDLGGQSIMILELHRRLRLEFETDLTVASLFQYPTISSLAGQLENKSSGEPDREGAKQRANRQRLALARKKSRRRNTTINE